MIARMQPAASVLGPYAGPENSGVPPVIARFDHCTANAHPTEANGSTDSAAYVSTTPSYNFWILGVSYDLNQRMTFALDWQKQQGTGFPAPTGTNIRAMPVSSSLFMQWQATF